MSKNMEPHPFAELENNKKKNLNMMLDYINLPRLHNEGVIFMIILENDIVNIYIYFYVAMVYQFIYRKN